MSTTSTFITVPEIQEVLTVSESKAYRIVRTLNEKLKKKGYMVIPGRVSRHYFNKMDILVRQSRQSSVARATCPD